MKLITLLTRLAAFGFAAFLAAVAFDVPALVSFALTVGIFVLLIAAHDYTPRQRLTPLLRATVVNFPTAPARSSLPHRLAA